MANPMLFDATTDPSILQVVLMGVGIVFVGLICIIGLCYLMSLIVTALFKSKPEAKASAPKAVATAGGPIENRQEIVAAVCAAVAEEEGTDISALRVISFKKL